MDEHLLLSIIVTSFSTDRIRDIYELLDSVKSQTYANLEVIFVAENSRELEQKIKSYVIEKAIPNVRVVFNDDEPGLSAARNLGIQYANGRIIGFVDDDAVLFHDWAEETVRAYEGNSIIGITGPAFPLWEDESMAWFPKEFYWILSCTAWSDWNDEREVRNAWGMNMSFRREAFDQIGGFTPVFGLCNSNRTRWVDPPSEDVDFSIRATIQTGMRIMFVPGVRVQHRVYRHRTSLKFVMQRAFSVGYQRMALKKLYGGIEKKEENLLNQEHKLLKRIFTKLIPEIFRGFFTSPVITFRKFQITIITLLFVTFGFCFYILFNLFSRRKYVYRKQ